MLLKLFRDLLIIVFCEPRELGGRGIQSLFHDLPDHGRCGRHFFHRAAGIEEDDVMVGEPRSLQRPLGPNRACHEGGQKQGGKDPDGYCYPDTGGCYRHNYGSETVSIIPSFIGSGISSAMTT
jgi:hypothetical protein